MRDAVLHPVIAIVWFSWPDSMWFFQLLTCFLNFFFGWQWWRVLMMLMISKVKHKLQKNPLFSSCCIGRRLYLIPNIETKISRTYLRKIFNSFWWTTIASGQLLELGHVRMSGKIYKLLSRKYYTELTITISPYISLKSNNLINLK